MTPVRPRRRFAGLLAVLLGSLGPIPARAIVDTNAPVSGPPVATPLPFPDPSLSATGGFLFQPPVGVSGEFLVREGQYSWAPDVAAAPTFLVENLLANGCTDLVLAQTLPLNPSHASVAFPFHLGQALDESKTSIGQLDTGGAGDFLEAVDLFLEYLALLPGASLPDPDVGDAQRACLSYEPVRARWLAAEYAMATPASSFETHFFYHTNPRPFREIRERGARLYCAARTAQFAQGDQVFSMGERVGFSVKVIGKTVDFFVTEPTLVFDGPERFTGMGSNNGAQAFEVPLLLGTRITPIRGLPLPGFREVRVPLSLVAADSELRTNSNLRLIPRPGQVVIQDYDETHQTVAHLDALLSAQKQASFGVLEPASVELFRVGPLAVEFAFFLEYGVGALALDDTRVVFLPGVPGARTGRRWLQGGTGRLVHDGAWQPRVSSIGFGLPFPPHWAVRPDGLTNFFWRQPITLGSLLAPRPLEIRLLQNDDHAATSTTLLTLGGSLGAKAGCCSFPPFEVSLTLSGQLDGTVRQIFHVRDSMLAQNQGGSLMTPITGLGVRSRQRAEANLDPFTATLHFSLELPFFEIDFEKTLFQVEPLELANYDSDTELASTNPADDTGNLRLGTGSRAGDEMKKPFVHSHFPGAGGEFQSFATNVDACLADPTENPPTPGPCDPVEPTGTTPEAELCVYGPSNLLESLLQTAIPADLCVGKIGSFVASLPLTGAQPECFERYFDFLCTDVSQQQAKDNSYSEVVSHVLELEDPHEIAAFQAMLVTCGAAFGSVNPDGTITGANEIASQLLEFGVCDEFATLLADDEVLGVIDPGVPPVTPAPPCH